MKVYDGKTKKPIVFRVGGVIVAMVTIIFVEIVKSFLLVVCRL